MKPRKLTPTEEAIIQIQEAIEVLSTLPISIEEYIEALGEVEMFVEASLDAARDDVARAAKETKSNNTSFFPCTCGSSRCTCGAKP